MEKLDRLIAIITDIAAGRYSDDILELTGPDTTEPVRTIAEALSRMMADVTAREDRLELLSRQLEEANQAIRRNIIATVSTMARALAARDAYTEGHAERVGRISGLIAAEMGLSEQDAELIQLAGLLHDIGKIGFPDSLFLPHGGSNSSETVKEITRHPVTGAEILKGLNFLGPAVAYVRYHHERPDGSEGESADAGLKELNKKLMNSWAGSGATCAEFMVFDSMTGTAVAAAIDDRSVGLREKFTRWGSVEDAFKHWAGRIRLVLDQTREARG